MLAESWELAPPAVDVSDRLHEVVEVVVLIHLLDRTTTLFLFLGNLHVGLEDVFR